MTSVGWGFIGIGKLADIAIAPGVRRTEEAHLAAVCSRSLDRARAFADKHDAARAYDDYDAMLADDAVDAVFIATPNGLHHEHVLAAVKAGKHVLVEKPMALSLEDGREMVAAAAAAQRLLGVGFHLRHKSNNERARDLIAAGRLGELAYLDLSIGAGTNVYPYDTWRADAALAGGGTTLHQGTHAIDLLAFLTQRRVVEVTAQMAGSPEDVFVATARLEDGVLATLSSHQVNAGTRPDWLAVGHDAWLQCRGGTSPVRGDVLYLHQGTEQSVEGETTVTAYTAEVASFTSAVAHGTPVNGTGEDGVANIAVVDALYESARTGRRVEVGQT